MVEKDLVLVGCKEENHRNKKMFSNDSKIQIAVLQERFKAHEQIIDKVDTAIQTLSETNQNICKMLAVHDERLDQCSKDDNELCKKVEDMESKIDGLYKFRWQIGGVIALALVLIGILPTLIPTLTKVPTSATIERAK
jgi:chromosome segregation ATPase